MKIKCLKCREYMWEIFINKKNVRFRCISCGHEIRSVV